MDEYQKDSALLNPLGAGWGLQVLCGTLSISLISIFMIYFYVKESDGR